MQVIYADVEITAYSEDEALDLFSEMDEAEMGFPFDYMSPQIEVDKSKFRLLFLIIIVMKDRVTLYFYRGLLDRLNLRI